jgi:tripartite-type tricarboxylate transporter receptor subunit TctC
MMTLIGSTQNVLAVNPKVPYKNVTGLIAYAKANPGRINMANAGSGFQSHLAGVLFAHIAGIDVHQIPYKGGTSTTMVAAGESHITIVPMPSVIGQLRAGRLLPLATGGDKRSQALPEVPTFIEAGVPGYVSTGWAGIVAPKGISRQRFDRIYGTLIKIMNNPVTREQLERQGAEPMTSTPEEMLRHINAEYGRFSQAIKLADLKVQ